MGSYAGQRRQTSSVSGWIKFALLGAIVSLCFQGALCDKEPTESECRPYIEKALKEQHLEVGDQIHEELIDKRLLSDQEAFPPTDELTDSTEGSITNEDEDKDDDDEAEIKTENEDDGDGNEDEKTEDDDGDGQEDEKTGEEDDDHDDGDDDGEGKDEKDNDEVGVESKDDDDGKDEDEGATDDLDKADDDDQEDEGGAVTEDDDDDEDSNLEKPIDIEMHEVEMDGDDDDDDDQTDDKDDKVDESETDAEDEKDAEGDDEKEEEKVDVEGDDEKEEEKEEVEGDDEKEEEKEEKEDDDDDKKVEDEQDEDDEKDKDDEKVDEDADEETTKADDDDEDAKEEEKDEEEPQTADEKDQDEDDEDDHKESITEEDKDEEKEEGEAQEEEEGGEDEEKSDDEVEEKVEKAEAKKVKAEAGEEGEDEEDADKESPEEDEDTDQEAPEEEELIKEMVIPDNLRPRDHIDKILKLEDTAVETILEKTIDTTLKGLKGLYDNAIKPLEMLYKYRDLSNRHFGDPEIFSKPLILFMGPWSGGKSSTINYLLDNEFSQTSLRTGAEPSPAYFNILMHGEEEEILDGTQLAADWTFSGLQKFGQGLLDRLKGVKLPNKLLEKVNIVEIPGILEIRKQVQRLFPFNDACQWFIDRADIIFLVYDPSKLDVGPETEAILDQLKGREYQTRIILNKADQVKPEELMRVQGTLIWNISPLMSSSEPPIMYSTSLWSLPYETGAPTRLLQAQERAFLKDLREAIDKRVENKISSARRFAVRVRNHAKMVDCYLTTYYNHKTIFGNRKKISDDIIEYPQKYHIYEGLSTLTNISRYDLPDPDVYRDFFKINPLYEFKKLSETCTYFRGCPINKLDVAIAYDLPELVGKYKKAVEAAKEQLPKENS